MSVSTWGNGVRALAARSGGGSVFFEQRTDVVLTAGRDRPRAVSIMPSRGAALGDALSSIHVTDPLLDAFSEPIRAEAAAVEEAQRQEGLFEAAIAGHEDLDWTLRVVAFHQNIWVSDPDGNLSSDTRRGCRAELKLGLGSRSHTVDWVASPEGKLASAIERLIAGPRRRLSPGTTCAVFDAGIAGLIAHELVGHALEGDVLQRRRTWIQGGLPKTCRPFRVEDDPRRGRAAWKTDDEGVSSRSVLLTDDDRVAGYLLDRTSAAARSAASTGHGRRSSFRDPVRPRMGCTFVHAGDDDPAAILSETSGGVFVRRMIAGHTDAVRGVASFIVTDADLIEAGRCTTPLEPFVMEVRGRDVWSSLDRIGTDLVFDACVGSCVRDGQPLAVSVGAPTIRLGVITVNC
ncbi:MAG TPA: metallopeptidase TldD-related protein [Candidatus Polarisedimenticolaceae bacterium]|nr:metallopeptidase TldD-related protein [Candidatus Polarisedimenticolaceae bacterium]